MLVLPVSVWADMMIAPRSASIAAQWSSDVAADDEPEAEQRLDHVRVQDVVRPGEQPVRPQYDGSGLALGREQ